MPLFAQYKWPLAALHSYNGLSNPKKISSRQKPIFTDTETKMLITLKYSQVYIFGILPGKAQKFFFFFFPSCYLPVIGEVVFVLHSVLYISKFIIWNLLFWVQSTGDSWGIWLLSTCPWVHLKTLTILWLIMFLLFLLRDLGTFTGKTIPKILSLFYLNILTTIKY